MSESAPGSYLITFTGVLGDMQLAELGAQGASVTVKTQGAASGTIGIDVFNIGAGASRGTITVTDTLPSGLAAKEAGDLDYPGEYGPEKLGLDPTIRHSAWTCTGNGPGSYPAVAGATVVTCTNNSANMPTILGGGGLPTPFGNDPDPPIGISVEAGGDATGLNNRVSIAGGGAPTPASTHDPVTVGPVPVQSGLTDWDAWFSNADGTIDTQAGSHPYESTTVFDLATDLRGARREGGLTGGELRNLEVNLPTGFIGDTAAVPQCTHTQLETLESSDCPTATEVGTL